MNGRQDAESVLARAIERREAARLVLETARTEFEAWQDFVERLTGLMTPTLRGASEPAVPAVVVLDAGQAEAATPKAVGVRGPTAEVIETERRAEALISERGSPIMPAQLLRLLAGDGFAVGGKDPSNTLSARLNRSSRFENIKGRGWWIKGRPLPSANGSEAADHGPAASQTGQPSDETRATHSLV